MVLWRVSASVAAGLIALKHLTGSSDVPDQDIGADWQTRYFDRCKDMVARASGADESKLVAEREELGLAGFYFLVRSRQSGARWECSFPKDGGASLRTVAS
jgi:hypothetical protein